MPTCVDRESRQTVLLLAFRHGPSCRRPDVGDRHPNEPARLLAENVRPGTGLWARTFAHTATAGPSARLQPSSRRSHPVISSVVKHRLGGYATFVAPEVAIHRGNAGNR